MCPESANNFEDTVSSHVQETPAHTEDDVTNDEIVNNDSVYLRVLKTP